MAGLDTVRQTAFDIMPDRAALEQMARNIGAVRIIKLRFSGSVQPENRNELRLCGDLRAKVTQRCVVSLEPVSCRANAQVCRRFLRDPHALSPGKDGEMSADDSVEPLADTIDLIEIACETLLLELPDYPRKAGLCAAAWSSDDGSGPLDDQTQESPFAMLGQLKR